MSELESQALIKRFTLIATEPPDYESMTCLSGTIMIQQFLNTQCAHIVGTEWGPPLDVYLYMVGNVVAFLRPCLPL